MEPPIAEAVYLRVTKCWGQTTEEGCYLHVWLVSFSVGYGEQDAVGVVETIGNQEDLGGKPVDAPTSAWRVTAQTWPLHQALTRVKLQSVPVWSCGYVCWNWVSFRLDQEQVWDPRQAGVGF